MSVLNENQLLGASGAGGEFEIEQSLRFDDGRTCYLKRTPTTASNRKTWTWSGWVKRTNINTTNVLFSSYVDSSNFFGIRLRENGDNGALEVFNYSSGNDLNLTTSQKFRDPSAWYHIVLAIDTTQGTAANRAKIYVNGNQVTSFGVSTYPSQNFDTDVNNTNAHYVGSLGAGNYHDGYLGEINFIDGQALTADSFGETGDYGEWLPTKYAGGYGTNGFYLPFEQDYSVEGFSTVVYEGNGASSHYVGGVGFQPDFTWIKGRNDSYSNYLFDSVRGANKPLFSDLAIQEYTYTDSLMSFDSDGYSLGAKVQTNNNGDSYVAWNWDMGGTTASNTSGSITSSVRANTAYGQSIVTYSANGSTGTIGHGLGAVPDMIIVKKRNAVERWCVFHTSTSNAYLYLNDTFSQQTGNADDRFGNNTSVVQPTSSVFTVGQANDVNASNGTYVAYCFSDVANYSKFSSYEGTGGTHTITLGFSPAFVMIKNADAASNWTMWDNTRNPNNPVTQMLRANTDGVEETKTDREPSFTATGFTIGDSDADTNASGQTYVYMAFADTREYAYWYDQSGNNNDWTSEGGLTESDVMVDSPTNNFATLNPLDMNIDSYAITVSEGNLQAAGPSEGRSLRSTMGMQSGKWYWEVCTTVSGIYNVAGIAKNSSPLNAVVGNDANSYTMFSQSGTKFNNGSTSSYGSAWNAVGDICGIAFDADNGTLVFYVNNSSQGTAFTGLTSGDFLPALGVRTGKAVVNFGQDSSFAGAKTPQGNSDSVGIGDFYYAPPTGFLALCTANLPSVDVIPSENFNPLIYSGTGADNRVLSGVGFTPDLGIFKRRNGTGPSQFFDTLRGATKQLRSDSDAAESTQGNKQKTFTSDGYTLGTDAQINGSGGTYVAWNWKAGGSASSNTNGNITSQVSANPSAGFSVVSYSGAPNATSDSSNNGGAYWTIGHGLAKAPEVVLVKTRSSQAAWYMGHQGLSTTPWASGSHVQLNNTNANANESGYLWGNSAPTSTVVEVGGWNVVNRANSTYIMYCFHSVDGYSKVGSYIGNGNHDGPFVYCGFKPKMVIFKNITQADDWQIQDTVRSPFNGVNSRLKLNDSAAEDTNSTWTSVDYLSNGFKQRYSDANMNASGKTYIFIAFAENPFKNSNAR